MPNISNNNYLSFEDKLWINILIWVLNQEENALNMVGEQVVAYIKTQLNLDDQKALVHLLKEQMDELLACNFENVNKACKAKGDLITLLCNTREKTRENKAKTRDPYS